MISFKFPASGSLPVIFISLGNADYPPSWHSKFVISGGLNLLRWMRDPGLFISMVKPQNSWIQIINDANDRSTSFREFAYAVLIYFAQNGVWKKDYTFLCHISCC